jgi:Rrf2 family protein
MKLSAQEEFGLRCLIAIGREGPTGSATIPQIAEAEGLTPSYVAKLLAALRKGGLVVSTRGKTGGYALARPAERITLQEVLTVLGGEFFDSHFCERHSGAQEKCVHEGCCSLRPLWNNLQTAVNRVLADMNLSHLIDEGSATLQLQDEPRRAVADPIKS